MSKKLKATPQRAERRAAPKPARASRETRLALRPSKPAQAGLEPRPTFPAGAEPGRQQSLRTVGAWRGAEPLARRGLQGRPAYSTVKGQS